jgi:hypothetical protein
MPTDERFLFGASYDKTQELKENSMHSKFELALVKRTSKLQMIFCNSMRILARWLPQ